MTMNLIYITALIVAMSGNMTLVQHKQGFQSHDECQAFLGFEGGVKYMEQSLWDYYGDRLKEVKQFSCMTRDEALANNKKLQEAQQGTDI